MATNRNNIRAIDHNNCVSRETILKISKEIAVKFIEVGRMTPATFPTTFKTIYSTISHVVKKDES